MALRATSSTLDTVLFVLLVGAAIGLLTGIDTADHDPSGRRTAETADILATSTATVEYERTVDVKGGLLGMRGKRTVGASRAASGTYAELLAAAAVAHARLDGTSLTGANGDFADAVENETERVLPNSGQRTQVRAVWRPYPEAPLESALEAGATPPEGTDVAATTLTVPSGLPNDGTSGLQAATTGGFDGVARALADDVVRGLFPLREIADAIRSDGPDRPIVVRRYDRAGAALGVETRPAIEDRDVERATDRLRTALADRLQRDLERRYDSTEAAARDLRTDRVRIVVRRWSA